MFREVAPSPIQLIYVPATIRSDPAFLGSGSLVPGHAHRPHTEFGRTYLFSGSPFGSHIYLLKAAWVAAAAALVVLATKLTAEGAEKVAATTATTENEVLSGVPIVAPAESIAVTTAVADPCAYVAAQDQAGISAPVRTTAGKTVPAASVTTTELEACAALLEGRGWVDTARVPTPDTSTVDMFKSLFNLSLTLAMNARSGMGVE